MANQGKVIGDKLEKEKLGKKWICPTTGKKFYDLNKDPVISPYSGETLSVIGTEDLEKEKTEINNLETTVNANKEDTTQSEEVSKVIVNEIENNSVDDDEILDHDDDEILDHDDEIIDTNDDVFAAESSDINTDDDSINEIDELEEFEIDEDLDEDQIREIVSKMFPSKYMKQRTRSSKRLKNNQILLCENIRFHPEEEEDDPIFAEKLSSLGDIYVNDAFSCCHRAHSSTHSITNFLPSYFGPMLCEEISALNRTLENPSKPSLAIIGGSKVSTKISVLKNLVSKLDSIIIGGGMANTFLFAKGAPMGNSLYEPNLKETANDILTYSKQKNCNILLPIDIITARKLEQNTKTNTSNHDECPADQMILDVGQKSIELFKKAINSSKTILWNGPLGAFEIKPFDNATSLLAKFTGKNTMQEKCISVAGGGDTVSALNSVKVTQQFSYVSSAGGAFLEWLEGKKLPGIEAIKSSKRII